MENVFGKTIPLSDIFTILIIIGIAIASIVWIVKTVKKQKNKNQDQNGGNDNRYNQNPGGNYQSSFH